MTLSGFDPALLAEQGRDPLFVVGPTRGLVYANGEARVLLAASYVVEVTAFGVVEGVDEAVRGPLRAAIIGALAQGRSACLDVILPCRPRYRLCVRPLVGERGEEMAVVTARNLDDYLQRCAFVAADRFDLSDAERRLAEGLLRGLSPADYADACGIKVSTVRSQLKALFSKIGVARQSDLVLRIGVLAE
jgi:DNA-binding CsgD family transcriptional regulator